MEISPIGNRDEVGDIVLGLSRIGLFDVLLNILIVL